MVSEYSQCLSAANVAIGLTKQQASTQTITRDSIVGTSLFVVYRNNTYLVDQESTDGTFYLSNDGGTTHKENANIGDRLYVNTSKLMSDIREGDDLFVHYLRVQTVTP